MNEAIRVFHQPGCSSCLRTKEYVASTGLPFEAIDVLNDAGGMDQLRALGVRRVPVVARGTQWVFGEDLAKVAALLGLASGARQALTPQQLHRKLDRVLSVAQRDIQAVAQAQLHALNPHRESRDLRNLAFHIFDIPIDFIEALDGAEYTQGMRTAPAELASGADLAGFGAQVRQRMDRWFAGQSDPQAWQRTIQTLWGEQSVYQLFERATWHSAQHTRQLEDMLEILGASRPDRLSAEDLASLPLPQRVWE